MMDPIINQKEKPILHAATELLTVHLNVYTLAGQFLKGQNFCHFRPERWTWVSGRVLAASLTNHNIHELQTCKHSDNLK